MSNEADFLGAIDDAFGDGMSGKFDEQQRKELLATSHIQNGYYTITFPDGGHRTFRVSTQPPDSKFAPGKRVVALLIGPDNTSDYEGMAFLTPAGIRAWKRFERSRSAVWLDWLWDMMNGEVVDGCELERSGRCLMCNRTLTSPESIKEGIGPICKGKLHGE